MNYTGPMSTPSPSELHSLLSRFRIEGTWQNCLSSYQLSVLSQSGDRRRWARRGRHGQVVLAWLPRRLHRFCGLCLPGSGVMGSALRRLVPRQLCTMSRCPSRGGASATLLSAAFCAGVGGISHLRWPLGWYTQYASRGVTKGGRGWCMGTLLAAAFRAGAGTRPCGQLRLAPARAASSLRWRLRPADCCDSHRRGLRLRVERSSGCEPLAIVSGGHGRTAPSAALWSTYGPHGYSAYDAASYG